MRVVTDEIIKTVEHWVWVRNEEAPLMFELYGEKYWVAAHGLAGIIRFDGHKLTLEYSPLFPSLSFLYFLPPPFFFFFSLSQFLLSLFPSLSVRPVQNTNN